MKSDYSVRISQTDEKVNVLNKECEDKYSLPRIKDYLFKPKGANLTDFHPKNIVVRVRDFYEQCGLPATLVIMKFK